MELIPPLMLVYVLPIPRSCIAFEAAFNGRLLDRRKCTMVDDLFRTEILCVLVEAVWPFPQPLGCSFNFFVPRRGPYPLDVDIHSFGPYF